jgi:tetratricopeptide (TPR) repeat protein
MAAADPPPSPFSEGDPTADDPAARVGGLGKAKSRQRIRIGRFLTKNPLPPPVIEGPPGSEPDPAPVKPRPEPPAVPSPIFDGVLGAAVLTLAAFLASFAAVNADLWLNLAAGRLVAHGQFSFGADPFSAAPGAVWINQAWLFDLFLYLFYRPGGAALVAAKAGLVVATAAVLLTIRRRRDSGGLGPAAATTLVLLAASPLFVLRSAVASYLLFAVLLLILHRRLGPAGKWQLPAAVGILFMVWVNLDGGFVFGLLLLAVWTVGAALQRVLPLGDDGDDPGEAPHPPGVLAAACVAALVGCLLNPYHVRVFRLPPELAVLTAPDVVRADPFVEETFREQFPAGPLTAAYVTQVGSTAAAALYLLLGFGLAGFAVNAGGWRWRRVLAWTAFACLGTTFGRTVPYFALIGGPAIVLNVQAVLGRWRTAWAEKRKPGAAHLRAVLAAAARSGLLMAVLGLLALAWPGWLGADATRRVAWRAVPDPTLERLAQRLDGWYKAGDLGEKSRGFHLQPEFSEYCAWFCPEEKGVFDRRLTAPPKVLLDYLAARRSLVALGTPAAKSHPESPDVLLRKLGTTHLVLSGGDVLSGAPFVTGLGRDVFSDSARFPAWAIAGRGVICGWGNSYPKLRMDPIQLTVGPAVEPLMAPPPGADAPGIPLTVWDRYFSALPPPAAETAEAGLWLAYHDATADRAKSTAFPTAQIGAELLRLAPTGPPMLFPLFDAQKQLNDAWQRSAEGRAGRAATVLAVRAARRAIRAAPDHPEAYVRLAQAYNMLETDSALGHIQVVTAARQGLARLKIVAPFRPTAAREELVLQEQLYNLYQQIIIPGPAQTPPLDLMLETLARLAELQPAVASPRAVADPASPEGQKVEQNQRRIRTALEGLSDEVRKRRDNFEIRFGNSTPAERADAAYRQYGLVREALAILQTADKLDAGAGLLLANLFLLTGETENARDVLQSPALSSVEGFPAEARPQAQLQIQILNVQVAAALGDYQSAIDHAETILDMTQPSAGPLAVRLIADLVLPDMCPANPLTRVGTMPAWAGLRQQGRPAAVNGVLFFGDLLPVAQVVRQYADWSTRQGLLNLECGDIPSARQRFGDAAKSPMPSDARTLALRWLELWR